jgi:hypothetical protein
MGPLVGHQIALQSRLQEIRFAGMSIDYSLGLFDYGYIYFEHTYTYWKTKNNRAFYLYKRTDTRQANSGD